MTEQYFTQEKVAKAYDAYIRKSIPFYDRTIDYIVEMLCSIRDSCNNLSNIDYIDIGTGTANVAEDVLASDLHLQSCQLVDHSAAMLSYAKQKISKNLPEHLKLHTIDRSFTDKNWEQSLPIQPVDIATMLMTLDHIQDDEQLQQLFFTMASILKPGAVLVVGEKCANMSENSANLFRKMIEIRASHMLKYGLKSPEDILKWKEHTLTEDYPRGLSTLLQMLENANFTFHAAAGVLLPTDSEQLTETSFFESSTLTSMTRAEVQQSTDQALGIGVLICRKTS